MNDYEIAVIKNGELNIKTREDVPRRLTSRPWKWSWRALRKAATALYAQGDL